MNQLRFKCTKTVLRRCRQHGAIRIGYWRLNETRRTRNDPQVLLVNDAYNIPRKNSD